MNNTPFIAASIASIALCIATPSLAAPIHDPYINAHQHRHHERIHQGVRSGQLTRSEVCDLAGQQRALRKQERGYKSDGVMTHGERHEMRQDQREASRAIYAHKHDANVQSRLGE